MNHLPKKNKIIIMKDYELILKYFELLKLFHIKYQIMENSEIPAKYIINDDLDINDDIEYKTIEDVQKICKWNIEWNFGDLISFSSYRDTWTYIIGKEGKLIPNPPYDGGAGYLSIPYEITKYLRSSKKKYENQEHIMYMDIRLDDDWIKYHFGDFKEEWNLNFTLDNIDNQLIINFNNNDYIPLYISVNLKYQLIWKEFAKCNNKLNNNLDDDCFTIIREYMGVYEPCDVYKLANNFYKNYYEPIDL